MYSRVGRFNKILAGMIFCCICVLGMSGSVMASSVKALSPAKKAGLQGQPAAKLCLMWQQPKPDEKKLVFPGRPEGVNVISPCWFSISDAQGNITRQAEVDPAYVKAARQSGMKIWPLVTNGGFDPELTTALLQNPEGRQHVAAALVQLVREYGFDGINLDFENVAAADRDALTSFVTELAAALHQQGAVVSMDVTVPSEDAYWSLCYDRKALAAQVDALILMGYDEYPANGSQAGSVAGLPWVQTGIETILQSGVPADKLVLGMPLYMRLWSERDGKVRSRTLHMPDAQTLWQQKNLLRRWLPEEGQYYFEYTEAGTLYRVWQEDARSLALKSSLISRYDLAGAALWKKGVETEDVWPVLAESLREAE